MEARYGQVLLEQDFLDWGLSGPYPGTERERTLRRPDPDGEPVPYETIACLADGCDAFARGLGLAFQRTDDCGLGWVDVAILDLPSGTRVGLMHYDGNPSPDHRMHVKVLPDQFINGFRGARDAVAPRDGLPRDRTERRAAAVSALDRTQDTVLRELAEAVGPHLVRVTWLRPVLARRGPPDPGPDVWEVWRQDDAGNRYLMQDRLNKHEALALAARYESLGHKQMYWAKRAGQPDDAAP